ncbi:MAG: chloride channel protein [Alphaproteobacteria bacterium]|nr:chloride channel protein [Alphaproteobacteria bacterium]
MSPIKLTRNASALLTRFFRERETGLYLIAAVIGIVGGVVVSAMSWVSQQAHILIFNAESQGRLSSTILNDRPYLLIFPAIGGILIGISLYLLARKGGRHIVDPVEANALYGGRLSVKDSGILAIQNLISNGFGASVGLEAGFTQLSSSVASSIGCKLHLRREDLRTLVGCGSAAAIAAAFGAPLAGAFYAFETIIGSYSASSLTPVVISAITGSAVSRSLGTGQFSIDLGAIGPIAALEFLPVIILGAICAVVAIGLMRSVATIEVVFKKLVPTVALRPFLGGCLIGIAALVSPQVLAGGHGALHLDLVNDLTMKTLLLLLALKALASVVSIGSGFRGGLFFGSLFMGVLLGKIFAQIPLFLLPTSLSQSVFAAVGMSSLAVAIVGGPLTMTFLVLETTGNFAITSLVLASAITASAVTRRYFGFSFSTWRLHMRGENIRGAHDVGWIRDLTVAKLMRKDVQTTDSDISLERLLAEFPLGSTQRVVCKDKNGAYAGILFLPELYSMVSAGQVVDLHQAMKLQSNYVLPEMNIKDAARKFEEAKSEVLAVVNNARQQKIVGLLSESHVLRRYSEELDKRRSEVLGV